VIWLYRAPYSTNVERVALALAHKGLEIESIEIDYDDRTPVIEASGQELVPVIDDGGEVVADSTRILGYLDEHYPQNPIFPADRARRAEIELMIDWFNEVWKSSPNAIEFELESDEPATDVVDAEGERMQEALGSFERLLEGRDHMAGDEVGALDFVVFPFLKYLTLPPADDDDELFHRILDVHQPYDAYEHSRLAAWIERVDALPRA
jgi:glutathione S-transferase